MVFPAKTFLFLHCSCLETMTIFSYSGERRQSGDGDDIIEGRAMDGNDSVDSKQDTTDMALFVQNLLQQMQSRFQTMSDSIITKNILFVLSDHSIILRKLNLEEMNCFVFFLLHHRIVVLLILGFFYGRLASRIDELEQSINDLKAEMGAENSPPPVPPAVKDDSKSPNES
ncbi:hypothetical protein PVK06_009624 [Gossypium arboreum]|uniref:Uncharacterized protein n=1 Tax=Gossypium arboreum TaxID=29729 RepID=A0ABR0QN11_GOSAR|nr:hypothetical protein PVK06_009624 [Gossypium arboreum]